MKGEWIQFIYEQILFFKCYTVVTWQKMWDVIVSLFSLQCLVHRYREIIISAVGRPLLDIGLKRGFAHNRHAGQAWWRSQKRSFATRMLLPILTLCYLSYVNLKWLYLPPFIGSGTLVGSYDTWYKGGNYSTLPIPHVKYQGYFHVKCSIVGIIWRLRKKAGTVA